MEKEILFNLTEQGLSIQEIALNLRKAKTTIRYWLKKFELKTKNLSPKQKKINPKPTHKTCSRCNTKKNRFEFYNRRDGTDISPYCKICTGEQTIERQRNFKIHCVKYKGEKCSICNYNKCINALEFHHLDPSQKDFSISNVKLYSFSETVKKELDKCILVCANCHREIHSKLIVTSTGIEPVSTA